MISIQHVLKKIDALEPVPQITNQVLEITSSDDPSIQDLAEIILHDSAITANLLKICNSPYMGLPMEVNSVHKAVSLLGLNQVVDLVLMKAIGKNLLKPQKGYMLGQGELWKQSVASALVSKHFAEQRSVHDKFLVYTAALLRDMGKIIIENYVGQSMSKIMHLVENKGHSFDEAEKEVLGLDHASIGALIAEKWNFSKELVYIIKNHHLTDSSAKRHLETGIVYTSDIVSMVVGIGIGADGLAYKFYEDVFNGLLITPELFNDLILEYHASHKKAISLLELN